jgi:hypothetical protein
VNGDGSSSKVLRVPEQSVSPVSRGCILTVYLHHYARRCSCQHKEQLKLFCATYRHTVNKPVAHMHFTERWDTAAQSCRCSPPPAPAVPVWVSAL